MDVRRAHATVRWSWAKGCWSISLHDAREMRGDDRFRHEMHQQLSEASLVELYEWSVPDSRS